MSDCRLGKQVVNPPATAEHFMEEGYLAAKPDVAAAVQKGSLKSGWQHFVAHGRGEGRLQRDSSSIVDAKARKKEKVRPLLRTDIEHRVTAVGFDSLTEDLRTQFHIFDTDAVSSNGYDDYATQLVEKHHGGLVLDCGAGRRDVYYDNVVNFEIVAYDTTDVRGGEVLPFANCSSDAVLSLAVLEHTRSLSVRTRSGSRPKSRGET